jgi:hypothetical protein
MRKPPTDVTESKATMRFSTPAVLRCATITLPYDLARASKESLDSLQELWTADGLTGVALLDAHMDVVTVDYVNFLFPASRVVLRNYIITPDERFDLSANNM